MAAEYRSVSALVLLLAFIIASVSGQANDPSNLNMRQNLYWNNANSFLIYHNVSMTYNNGLQYCGGAGGTLSSIRNAGENNYLSQALLEIGKSSAWIGIMTFNNNANLGQIPYAANDGLYWLMPNATGFASVYNVTISGSTSSRNIRYYYNNIYCLTLDLVNWVVAPPGSSPYTASCAFTMNYICKYTPNTSICPSDWLNRTGDDGLLKCYKNITLPTTWWGAVARCYNLAMVAANQPGYLLYIDSSDNSEMSFLSNLAPNTVWLGAVDLNPVAENLVSNYDYWIDNTIASYTPSSWSSRSTLCPSLLNTTLWQLTPIMSSPNYANASYDCYAYQMSAAVCRFSTAIYTPPRIYPSSSNTPVQSYNVSVLQFQATAASQYAFALNNWVNGYINLQSTSYTSNVNLSAFANNLVMQLQDTAENVQITCANLLTYSANNESNHSLSVIGNNYASVTLRNIGSSSSISLVGAGQCSTYFLPNTSLASVIATNVSSETSSITSYNSCNSNSTTAASAVISHSTCNSSSISVTSATTATISVSNIQNANQIYSLSTASATTTTATNVSSNSISVNYGTNFVALVNLGWLVSATCQQSFGHFYFASQITNNSMNAQNLNGYVSSRVSSVYFNTLSIFSVPLANVTSTNVISEQVTAVNVPVGNFMVVDSTYSTLTTCNVTSLYVTLWNVSFSTQSMYSTSSSVISVTNVTSNSIFCANLTLLPCSNLTSASKSLIYTGNDVSSSYVSCANLNNFTYSQESGDSVALDVALVNATANIAVDDVYNDTASLTCKGSALINKLTTNTVSSAVSLLTDTSATANVTTINVTHNAFTAYNSSTTATLNFLNIDDNVAQLCGSTTGNFKSVQKNTLTSCGIGNMVLQELVGGNLFSFKQLQATANNTFSITTTNVVVNEVVLNATGYYQTANLSVAQATNYSVSLNAAAASTYNVAGSNVVNSRLRILNGVAVVNYNSILKLRVNSDNVTSLTATIQNVNDSAVTSSASSPTTNGTVMFVYSNATSVVFNSTDVNSVTVTQLNVNASTVNALATTPNANNAVTLNYTNIGLSLLNSVNVAALTVNQVNVGNASVKTSATATGTSATVTANFINLNDLLLDTFNATTLTANLQNVANSVVISSGVQPCVNSSLSLTYLNASTTVLNTTDVANIVATQLNVIASTISVASSSPSANSAVNLNYTSVGAVTFNSVNAATITLNHQNVQHSTVNAVASPGRQDGLVSANYVNVNSAHFTGVNISSITANVQNVNESVMLAFAAPPTTNSSLNVTYLNVLSVTLNTTDAASVTVTQQNVNVSTNSVLSPTNSADSVANLIYTNITSLTSYINSKNLFINQQSVDTSIINSYALANSSSNQISINLASTRNQILVLKRVSNVSVRFINVATSVLNMTWLSALNAALDYNNAISAVVNCGLNGNNSTVTINVYSSACPVLNCPILTTLYYNLWSVSCTIPKAANAFVTVNNSTQSSIQNANLGNVTVTYSQVSQSVLTLTNGTSASVTNIGQTGSTAAADSPAPGAASSTSANITIAQFDQSALTLANLTYINVNVTSVNNSTTTITNVFNASIVVNNVTNNLLVLTNVSSLTIYLVQLNRTVYFANITYSQIVLNDAIIMPYANLQLLPDLMSAPQPTLRLGRVSYYMLNASGLTWARAVEQCAVFGATLASIMNDQETQLYASYAQSANIWLGGLLPQPCSVATILQNRLRWVYRNDTQLVGNVIFSVSPPVKTLCVAYLTGLDLIQEPNATQPAPSCLRRLPFVCKLSRNSSLTVVPACPSGWQSRNGSLTCYLYVAQPLTWAAALTYCTMRSVSWPANVATQSRLLDFDAWDLGEAPFVDRLVGGSVQIWLSAMNYNPVCEPNWASPLYWLDNTTYIRYPSNVPLANTMQACPVFAYNATAMSWGPASDASQLSADCLGQRNDIAMCKTINPNMTNTIFAITNQSNLMTFEQAAVACGLMNGSLATLVTPEDMHAVSSLLNQTNAVKSWMGLMTVRNCETNSGTNKNIKWPDSDTRFYNYAAPATSSLCLLYNLKNDAYSDPVTAATAATTAASCFIESRFICKQMINDSTQSCIPGWTNRTALGNAVACYYFVNVSMTWINATSYCASLSYGYQSPTLSLSDSLSAPRLLYFFGPETEKNAELQFLQTSFPALNSADVYIWTMGMNSNPSCENSAIKDYWADGSPFNYLGTNATAWINRNTWCPLLVASNNTYGYDWATAAQSSSGTYDCTSPLSSTAVCKSINST